MPRRLWSDFEKLYSHTGRPSIPPERLLRALLLQVLYSIRSNDTHQSTTDPDARLMTKGGQEAKLYFMGHVVMENRHGLAVGARLTHATGRAEREVAVELLEDIPRRRRITLGADKGYDVPAFVEQLRQHDVTPHVAQKVRYTAVDGRTTRHLTCQVSQRLRKRVEEIFGNFTFALAAYNLVRIRSLTASTV